MFQMASERYWNLVNSLIERGIVTREQWQSADCAEYRYYSKGFVRGFNVRKVLRDVIRFMCWNKLLGNYLLLPDARAGEGDISQNPFYRVLRQNGYDSAAVGTLLYKWSMLTSDRNTVWIKGAPDTGAPYLAEALAYTAPVVGCIDWRNRCNPFERCLQCLLYWMDGGLLPESSIGLCKQVLRGEGVMIQVPDGFGGKRFRELNRTPVLISSNHDVCLTYVRLGVTCKDHVNSLRDCMYVIELKVPYGDGPAVTCNDARAFVTWASMNPRLDAEREFA